MSEITTVPVQMNVPKEFKELIDVIDKLAEKIMAKVSYTEYIALFDDINEAVDGMDQIDDEARSQYRSDAMAYMSKILMDRFMPISPEA